VRQTLVTGGGGFIGQHLVALLARDRRVRILDFRPPAWAPAGTQYVNGSVLDPAAVHDALEDIDEVYHLAGLPGVWMPCKERHRDRNRRVAQARRHAPPALLDRIRSVWSSELGNCRDRADQCRARRHGAYTRSKMRAEQAALAAARSGFPDVITNPTMPIGRHHGNLTPRACASQARSGGAIFSVASTSRCGEWSIWW
jgi:dihydroflavonol-4-reductase